MNPALSIQWIRIENLFKQNIIVSADFWLSEEKFWELQGTNYFPNISFLHEEKE